MRHIAADNQAAALRTGQDILESTRLLGDFPQAGRILPEEGRDSVREIIHRPYRVIYELSGADEAVVLRVWHAARGKPEL
ncbi:MAG: type II toxin-antitoxin system RelE/ParE family toxin [Opitutae bacterium]|nr:type II toxin-antitoxin system RelE/ParE family toxin [Opitutae bacterium]